MNFIVFLGAPGSGKGTQAQVLADTYKEHVIHLSTGQLLRDAIAEGSECGLYAKSLIDAGLIVCDEVVFNLLEEKLKNISSEKRVILDGFPRTLNQAVLLENFLQKTRKQIEKVVYFDIADAELVNRLTGRFMCADCGAVYHKHYNSPQQDGVCDFCGSHDFKVRDDDNEFVVKKRLDVYHAETEPLVSYYDAQGVLFRLDAAQSVESIKKTLLKKIKLVAAE
ncbi:MAG: adenylate kinase [Candidatus Paracaedibacteraceae bacterium]|nr:adenylate kinase [Candidatus Paracaedibacteraceae bacterium]